MKHRAATLVLLLSSLTSLCHCLVPDNNGSRSKARKTLLDSQRREMLQSAAWGISSTVLLLPKTAHAVKPANEALCGTGFFTNIAQYRCTDIGDISDEGKSRKLSQEETSSLDSLMGKFDLDGRTSSSSSTTGESNSPKPSIESSSASKNEDMGNSAK